MTPVDPYHHANRSAYKFYTKLAIRPHNSFSKYRHTKLLRDDIFDADESLLNCNALPQLHLSRCVLAAVHFSARLFVRLHWRSQRWGCVPHCKCMIARSITRLAELVLLRRQDATMNASSCLMAHVQSNSLTQEAAHSAADNRKQSLIALYVAARVRQWQRSPLDILMALSCTKTCTLPLTFQDARMRLMTSLMLSAVCDPSTGHASVKAIKSSVVQRKSQGVALAVFKLTDVARHRFGAAAPSDAAAQTATQFKLAIINASW